MGAGDITLTTPKTTNDSTFQIAEININLIRQRAEIIYQESVSKLRHRVVLTDASCEGVDYNSGTGTFTDEIARAVTGEYTKLLGAFKAGALTTITSTLKTDGVLTINGTVV